MVVTYTENLINIKYSSYDWPENCYSGIFEMSCKFKFRDDGFNMTAIYKFSRDNQEILVW